MAKKKRVKESQELIKESASKEKELAKEVRKRTRRNPTTIDDILQKSIDTFNQDSNSNLELKGFVMNSEQQQQLLTGIALGIVKDGLTLTPATLGEKMKAVEILQKIQQNEVGGKVIEEHNESIKRFEMANQTEVKQRNLEDFE